MCLATPLRIERRDGSKATVALAGTTSQADLTLVPEADVGDWVLVHAGFAIAVLDGDEAAETFEVLRRIDG